mmetsp:Transcript_8649/g.16755  ORF Transcript_8649/g.16755 Transcript_8649/m.16755 type:complete len:250 (-) Transcript_8649:521-1270(-)
MSALDNKEFVSAADSLVNTALRCTNHILGNAGILLTTVQAKKDYEWMRDILKGDDIYLLEQGVRDARQKWSKTANQEWDKFVKKIKETKKLLRSMEQAEKKAKSGKSVIENEDFCTAADSLCNQALRATNLILGAAGILLTTVEAKGDYQWLQDIIKGDDIYVIEKGAREARDNWTKSGCQEWDAYIGKLRAAKKILHGLKLAEKKRISTQRANDAAKVDLVKLLSKHGVENSALVEELMSWHKVNQIA